jgi:hypothetical protein
MGFQPDLGILRPKLAAACLKGVFRPSTRICCCACSAFCRLVDGRDTSSRRAAGRPLAPASAALVSSVVHHAAGHELSRRSATSSSGSATGQTLLELEELIIIRRLHKCRGLQAPGDWWCVSPGPGTVCELREVVGGVWIRARIEERWWELTWALGGFYFSAGYYNHYHTTSM